MSYLIVLVVALVVFWLWEPARSGFRGKLKERASNLTSRVRAQLAEAWRKLEQQAEPAAGPAPQIAGPADETASGESLSVRLQRLDSVFGPAASNSAHPRELAEHPQFVEAVALLKAAGVPLDTVLQYALGANWSLACAALAALKERPDGGEAVNEVLTHFDKLYPWPLHYALAYLTAAQPRPSVGAPLANAKEWWGDNVVLPGMFREYFAERERLGDAPLFGDRAPQAEAQSPQIIMQSSMHMSIDSTTPWSGPRQC